MIGRTLGHYQITEKLREGRTGAATRAHDTRLDCDVAIKTASRKCRRHQLGS